MMLNQRYANADIVFLMRGATNNKPIIESLAKIMPDLDERICNQLEIQSGYRLELRYKVCGYSDVI